MSAPRHILLQLIFTGIITVIAIAGLPGIPFHPDESTQLFMSSDIETLRHAPLSLVWDKT